MRLADGSVTKVYYVRNTRFELFCARIAEAVLAWTKRQAWKRRTVA